MLAALCFAAASVVERSRDEAIWEETSLFQVEQLSAARGYKRPSPAYMVAVTEVCASTKRLRHVGGFLASKAVANTGKGFDSAKEGDYFKTERYSYFLKGMQTFKDATSVSLSVDACSVGADNLLNVLAWHCERKVGIFCAPQALGY